MSDSDQVLEGSGAVENGNRGLDHGEGIEPHLFESELVPAIQIHVPIDEESNGLLHSEYSVDAPSNGAEAAVRFAVAEMGDSVHHVPYGSGKLESSSLQVDDARHLDDSVQGDPDDVKVAEDAGKEDMFVDASEELSGYDGRNADTGKPQMVSTENIEWSMEQNRMMESRFHELENGAEVNQLVDELERLRAMLEKTVGEKEVLAKENKEERANFAKELANLRLQLKALTDQPLPGENDGGLLDRLHKAEMGDEEEKIEVDETPLHAMINECSESLKSALEERLQNEGTLRELHAILYMKDQEIEDLNAKVTELSVARDVVVSYLTSIQNTGSHSVELSSEVQFEKGQHIDSVINRMLDSLAAVVHQEELLDDSVAGKISHIEKSTSLLIENYNLFLSEIDQLRQCLIDAGSGLRVQEEFGMVFVAARDEFIELRRKEADFVGKLSHLEDKNKKLVEQLEKEKGMVKMVNAELGKTKMELEQEKTKCANVKEKLSLAVTKGKALVQQRDSLRQSLAEKTSSLEKCMVELQEKSSALGDAELSKEESVKSKNLAASLQEALSQRDIILENLEEILSETNIPEGVYSVDMTEKIRWLVNERNVLKGVSLEFDKLRDAFSRVDLPEAVSSLELESQVGWIIESFYRAKNEIIKLQDVIARTGEAAHNKIDRLTSSLSAEIQEKDYLQMELDDLTRKYEGIVENQRQFSLEKDQIVRILLEASGITLDDQEGIYQTSADMLMLVDRCLGKMKEQSSASFESYRVEAEIFERILTLLYVRDQELMLYEKILEEEVVERSEVNSLSNELRVASQELIALKGEKDSLRKDLDRSEEKSAVLREKLSMAVKKGKGLVQDRENLRSFLDEKNKEIEKLKLELQQQESIFGDYRDQINRFSIDVERIPKLEAELVALKDQRDQLEKFLVESNNMLQRLIESIDGIVLPVDSVFEEPVEKLKWLVGYFSECEVAKTCAEQELEKVKEEISMLATKLAEAHTTIRSLEDAWSVAENRISQLAEEKRELEVGKTHFEQELEKALEEAHSQTSKFIEACSTRKSLEDALSLAENNLSALINEKEDAQVGRAAVETELGKVKEEVAIQTDKLAEAYRTIKTLEDTLSQVETNVLLLTEENNNTQVGRTNLENEIKKLKDEVTSQAGNLADANTTIKSLEDALLKAENNISVLVGEKRSAEEELSTLNSKLNACMEELSGTHGSLKGRSVELIGQLNNLQVVMKDETLSSLLSQSFEKNFQKLKDMDIIVKNIRDHFIEMGAEKLQNDLVIEEDSYVTKLFSNGLDNTVNIEMDNGEVIAADGDDISSDYRKTVEALHLRNKFLADKVEGFSSFMDEFTAALLRKLQATSDEVIVIFENMTSLKQKVKGMEMYKQAQENTIAVLENDITTLLSACTDATKELQYEVENKLLELSSVPELGKLDHSFFPQVREVGVDATEEDQQRLDGSKYVKIAENLLSATRKVQTLTKRYENTRNVLASTIEDLHN
ncbi:hypothetical protein L1049_005658 [Liquidambar formosana]|uniref:Uncharacterized protein n=1 Tax=Liquidambar formosana TaxID=63359 RepID=A0AAP0WPW7_LIQFO